MLVVQCMHDNLLNNLGAARKVILISEDRCKKIQVKHDLGKRLYGGQGQNKIGGAHLRHVGSAMHA